MHHQQCSRHVKAGRGVLNSAGQQGVGSYGEIGVLVRRHLSQGACFAQPFCVVSQHPAGDGGRDDAADGHDANAIEDAGMRRGGGIVPSGPTNHLCSLFAQHDSSYVKMQQPRK